MAARSVLSPKHLCHSFRAAPTLRIQHTVSNIFKLWGWKNYSNLSSHSLIGRLRCTYKEHNVMKGNENPSVSLLVLNNTANFFVILKKINFIFLLFVVNLERFFMKRFKILTVPVNQNIPVVKYTVFFRKSRSNHHISFKYLNIYFWFHIAVTNSWPCWSVTSLLTQTLKNLMLFWPCIVVNMWK